MINKDKIVDLSIKLKVYKYLKYLYCRKTVINRYFQFAKSKKRKKRIVFLGQVNSIHFKTFFEKFQKNPRADDYEVLLICSYPHYSLIQEKGIRVIDLADYYRPGLDDTFFKLWLDSLTYEAKNIIGHKHKDLYAKIREFSPDVLWIHDLQSGGYLASNWLEKYSNQNVQSRIAITTYGNDLFLYYDHPIHRLKINQILKWANFVQVETNRDREILEYSTFSGEILPITSATYRSFLEICKSRGGRKKSKDIFLIVKGSTHMRSSLIYLFEHIRRNSFFSGKKIVIYGATQEDVFFCKRLEMSQSIDIEFNRGLTNDDFLSMLERSSFSLNLNISDGIANTLIEGIKLGCLPFFSKNSGVLELLDAEYHQYVVYDPFDSEFGLSHLMARILDDEISDVILDNFLINMKEYFDDSKYDLIFESVLK